MKFILIDDNQNDLECTYKIISSVFFKLDVDYDVLKFNKYCKELETIINDNAISKVYIIDIELDKTKSGLDIAKQIRQNDWDSEIIFITNHDRMFETVYKTIYKVFNFIEKFDHMAERLETDLTNIIRRKDDKMKFIHSNQKISIQIYLKDIICIYKDTVERKLVIQTTNNKFLLNMTIQEALTKLDERFIQVHRACIVNNERIEKYNWAEGYFTTDKGEDIYMLSKNFRKDGK